MNFSFLNVNTTTIATAGSLLISSGGTLVFDINSLSNYGSIGSIGVSGATIDIAGTYTGNTGDAFHLTSGSFSGATLGELPTLSAGLTWNTSQFSSSGVLTVAAIPEPSTYALLVMGLGICLFLRHHRLARKRAWQSY